MNTPKSPLKLTILLPCYNDDRSAQQLIAELDQVLTGNNVTAHVVVVDDFSQPAFSWPEAMTCETLASIEILRLRRNLGHQRAIATGLSYLAEHRPSDAVVVMDSDGEDKPSDVLRLIEAFRQNQGREIIFAERTRRSESWSFLLFYRLYCWLHLLLTGLRVRVGNFSILPYGALNTLTCMSELWNHYAAAVFVSKLPHTAIPTHRGHRYAGRSHMNYVSLIAHGLSAISVYGEKVGTRLLVGSGLLAGLFLLAVVVVIVIRLGTDLAIPGWASYTIGISLVLVLQLVLGCFLSTFFLLSSRNRSHFIPSRDATHFIAWQNTKRFSDESA